MTNRSLTLVCILLVPLFLPDPARAQETKEQVGDFTLTLKTPPSHSHLATEAVKTPRQYVITRGYHEGTLTWRCDGTKLEVIFDPDQFLGDDEPIPLLIGFEEDTPPTQAIWDASTRGREAFAYDFQVVPFTTSAAEAGRVEMSLERGKVYEFSLMGLREGLERMGCASLAFEPEGLPGRIRSGVHDGEAAVWIEGGEEAAGGIEAEIRWSCGQEKPAIQFSLESARDASKLFGARVQTVFDDSETEVEYWTPVRAGNTSIVEGMVDDFSRKMLESSELVLRFQTAPGSARAIRFLLDGLQRVLEEAGCPWGELVTLRDPGPVL